MPFWNIADANLNREKYRSLTLTPAQVALTIDLAPGRFIALDLENAGGALTLTLSNPEEGITYGFAITQGTTLGDIVWPPGSVLWPGGSPPVITATNNAVDYVMLVCIDSAGPTFLGSALQNFS